MMKLPMTRFSVLKSVSPLRSVLAAAILTASAVTLQAQTTTTVSRPRITAAIDSSSRAVISGSRPMRANPANDVGKVSPDMKLQGITLVFNRSAAQEEALQTLIAAQQNPASPLYHQWLTPDQFAAQFGMAAADIARVQSWLQGQGFTVDSTNRSHDRISFSGTAAQVASTFATELHYYKSADGTMHYAPSSDISVPAALASVVRTVTNLSSFHLKPRIKPRPAFTSSQTGSHFMTPLDVATVYDINPAYNAGFTGSNQTIAIVGQSAVYTTDITNFQTALGLPARSPTLVLMPGTGASAINPLGSGDEGESDLDLEYSGAIAKGANILFVYTGNSGNYGAFDALQYAVDERIAPIVSISYGECETNLGSTNYTSLNAILAQAASQGQSVISAAGDSGSTDCYPETNLTAAQREALAVDFPASSQYVTGMGGTEFPTADVAIGNNTYFAAAPTTDVVSSALSYIPEEVWNDDVAAEELSSGGGGVSIFTSRPTWQSGVTGITAGSYRLVPDISLNTSDVNAPYAFCTSDTSDWNSGQTSSCTSGLRDSSSQDLTLAGGTSFAAPIFSGMLALINQGKGPTGQGVVNPTLYLLAASPTTYASAFHDITSGGNECLYAPCSTAGAANYAATTGYDEATGLGSLDFYQLLTAWPSTISTTLLASNTKLTAATTVPAAGASDSISITVAPNTTGSVITPTGNVTLTVDGTVISPALSLTAGATTYSFSSTTTGEHVIVASYSGDGVYAASTSTITLNVGGTVASTGSFTITATNVTVTAGQSGTSTITVTPSGGYLGTVNFTIGGTNNSADITNACATGSSVNVTGTAAQTMVITIYTSSSACPSGAVPFVKGATGTFANGARVKVIAGNRPVPSPYKPLPLELTAGCLLLAGLFGRRSRKLRPLLAIGLLAVIGAGLSGCGENSSAPASYSYAPKGTYNITLTGSDSVTSSIASTTTFTLTVN
jgi:subtilase family serine protease